MNMKFKKNTEKFEKKKNWDFGILNLGVRSTFVCNFMKKYQETYSWQIEHIVHLTDSYLQAAQLTNSQRIWLVPNNC